MTHAHHFVPCVRPRQLGYTMLLCVGLQSCVTGSALMKQLAHPSPRPSAFVVCHGYGCAHSSRTQLSADEWQEAIAPFSPEPDSAERERMAVAVAVARLETIAGRHVGTNVDLPEASWFAHDKHQLDCLDEALNTTTYLSLLEQAGLLRWHRVAKPAHRGYYINGWPHNTAVLAEQQTRAQYAVDSYYGDSGEPPAIVPLQRWLAGWTPAR